MHKLRNIVKHSILTLVSLTLVISSMGMSVYATEKEEVETSESESTLFDLVNLSEQSIVPSVKGVTRISGKDRCETSLLIADIYKEVLGVEKFDAAIIVADGNLADTISASYLAYQKKAPILSVNNTTDSQNRVVDYIKENVYIEGSIYIIGEIIAVSNGFGDKLRDETGGYVTWAYGDSYWDTNFAALYESGVGNTIILTCKDDLASLSSVALGKPIMLNPRNSVLSEYGQAFLERVNVNDIIFLRNNFHEHEHEYAHDSKLENSLKDYGTVNVFSGSTHIETSLEIAKAFFNKPTAAIITSSADGIVAGPLAAQLGIPLILTHDSYNYAPMNFAKESGICAGYVIDAEYKLSDETVVDFFSLNNADEILLRGVKLEDDITPPEIPKNAKVYKVTASSFSLRWKESPFEDIVKYEVSDWNTKEVLAEVAEAEAVITGLEAGKEYTIAICAIDEAGNKSEALLVTVSTEKPVMYTIGWDTDGDGDVDDTTEYEYGETPAHDDGHKESDVQYTYTFTGWNPKITTVTEDRTYTAQYDKTLNRYTISWDTDGDGDVDDTTEYEYGETPAHDDGYKKSDAQYTYTFTGWSPNITNVVGDQTYTAQFDLASLPEQPIVPTVKGVARISGENRYNTSLLIADVYKEILDVEKFEAVVVATGKNFADALAGSYLAVEKNAPILLTNGKDGNVEELHAYIKANVTEGGMIYILGGDAAVPVSVEAIEGYEVERLSGNSRYDTNLEILAEAGVSGNSIIVATGKSFADSLSASAAKLPILLLNPKGTLNDAQKEILAGMKNIYIAGGEGAVSEAYEEELKAYGEVTRVFGQSRYDTSVEVAKSFFGDVDTVVVASGKNFPDGLCGGPLAAALNAPLVLIKDGAVAKAAAYVAEEEITGGYVLGGDGTLTDETVVNVFKLNSTAKINEK